MTACRICAITPKVIELTAQPDLESQALEQPLRS
jgi:hypothetical protein